MTPSLNYAELRTNLQNQLSALQAEKLELLTNLQTIERRIKVVEAHETPLLRVLESLTELQNLTNGNVRAVNIMTDEDYETSRNATVSEASGSNTLDIDNDGSNEPINIESVKIDVAVNEADKFDDAVDAIYTDAEDIETEFSANGITELPTVQPFAVAVVESLKTPEEPEISTQEQTGEANVKDMGKADVSESAKSAESGEDLKDSERENSKQPTGDVVEDFNATNFYKNFPHLTPVHPVHIFARYLLEYFGFGLKLSQIARLIERSGYKHSSRNFTDSVHSALKNKRKTTGEFYFNAADRVWELSHWSNAKAETKTAKRVDKTVKANSRMKISEEILNAKEI